MLTAAILLLSVLRLFDVHSFRDESIINKNKMRKLIYSLHLLVLLVALESQSTHLFEGLLYIEIVLSWSLEVRNNVLGRTVLLDLGLRHLALTFLVTFVSDHDEGEVVRVLRVELAQELRAPCVDSLERLGVRQVEAQHAALCIAVEGCPYWVEFFLPRGVPKLRLLKNWEVLFTCNWTTVLSRMISLVRKSAPIVVLYW